MQPFPILPKSTAVCGKWNQAPTHVPPALSFPARQCRKTESPASELQVPYQQKGKEKRYYVIGRRPLDGLGSVSTTKLDWIKKWDKNTYKSGKGGLPDLLPEHRHFFDSEGNDFGFFGDDNVRPDRKRNLPLYTYGDVKYDADIIDRAVREYETYINQVQEKISTFTKSTKDIITNQVHGHVNVGNYGLILNNCQDYVSNILYIARRISEKERIPIILP